MFVVIMTHDCCISKCISRNIFGGFKEYTVLYSTVTVTVRAVFTNTGQIAGLLNSSYF